MPTPPLPLEKIQHTVDLYQCGYTFREIAQMLGLSKTAVRHRIVVLGGVTPRPPGRRG